MISWYGIKGFFKKEEEVSETQEISDSIVNFIRKSKILNKDIIFTYNNEESCVYYYCNNNNKIKREGVDSFFYYIKLIYLFIF